MYWGVTMVYSRGYGLICRSRRQWVMVHGVGSNKLRWLRLEVLGFKGTRPFMWT